MLLLGGVLAVLAFFVLYIGLSAAGNSAAPAVGTPTPEPKVQVVVAATDIQAFTVLTDEMLTTKMITVSTVISDNASSTVGLVGKMTTRDYKQEDQINARLIRDPGISQILEKGQRAFALPLQEINNFGGQLVENDNIDLIWTRQVELTQAVVGASGTAEDKTSLLPTTKTILQNIKVLRMVSLRATTEASTSGTSTDSSSTAVNTDASIDSGTSSSPENQAQNDAAMQSLYNDSGVGQSDPVYTGVAILAITDQQAEVIKFMRENGKLSIALRAKDDTDTEVTTGITDKILVQDYGLILPELVVGGN
jgi:Flp pilus assembly protein CpaB